MTHELILVLPAAVETLQTLTHLVWHLHAAGGQMCRQNFPIYICSESGFGMQPLAHPQFAVTVVHVAYVAAIGSHMHEM